MDAYYNLKRVKMSERLTKSFIVRLRVSSKSECEHECMVESKGMDSVTQ